jgi:predicted ATPase/DNA-binding XRE family transcriptional regulator
MAVLASLLGSLRKRAGLTQEELATCAGLSTRTISDIERGLRVRLYADTAERLATALGLDEELRDQLRDAARGRTGSADLPTGLPRPLTELVGREEEVHALVALLAPDGRRLVTVTGLGGVGKSRVALAACEYLMAAYEGMVHFAPVAPNLEPSSVPGLISAALGAPSDLSAEQLRSHLADRPALVLLDSFEHVLDAAPALESLLTVVPSLHLLVTSRVRIPVIGVHELALEPLPVPEAASTTWDTAGAAALFLARAADVQADARQDPELVIEVCRRVSGLPLALELAAARLRHLPLGTLAERLRDDLVDLNDTKGGRRSLAGIIASSVSALGPARRSVLSVCSLFVAGWRQDILQDVCGSEMDVLGAMSELVDLGLVLVAAPAAGDMVMPRWRMLDVVRDIVSRSDEKAPELRDAYVGAMLSFTSRTSRALGQEDTWFRVLATEEPNVLTALRWAEEAQDAETVLRLACSVWQFWQAAGALTEGRRWLATGLQLEPPASSYIRMTALWGSGWLAYQQGDYTAAAAAGTELSQLASTDGGQAERRNALTLLGMVAIADERSEEAVELLEGALSLARTLDQPWLLATSLLNTGLARLAAGHPEDARIAVGEALRRYAEIGDERFHARSLGYLGLISLLDNDLDRARALLAKSLAAFHTVGEPAGMAEAFIGLAAVHAAKGERQHAALLAGAGERLREGIAGRALPLDRRTTEKHLETARASLAPEVWDEAMRRGRELQLEDAVHLATDATS